MEVISLFTEFVKRPGLDKLGHPIRLRINYFEITDFPFNNVYHYEIVILPEVPPTLNRKIFRMSDVTMPEDNTNNVDRRPPRIFKIRIKKVAEIHMEEINMFLDRRGLMTSNVLTGIMALNVLIHHMPSMMLKRREFLKKYNMQLQHPFLPCIVIREETYLPLEGQLFMRKLNERHGKYDCQPSQSRANKINQGIGILNYQQDEYMQQFDFRVSNEMAITQARILPAPNYSIILLLEIVQEMVYGI
ncbi:unnamed protein product [Rhizophagus irregularis]|nr:unnamed protein product [Rhizophagus irregularis]